jgi:hypothetical protein
MTSIARVPLDLDAITARAQAAPDGYWVTFPDSIWIPWHADTDATPCSPHDHGRYIAVQDGDWLNSGPAVAATETPEHLAQRIYEAACSAPGAIYEIMAQPAWENLDPVHRACWLAAAVEARRTDEITIWRHAATLTAWLDAANPRTDHEVACRVMKLAEETGEAVPRKGTYATLDDLTAELCDVIVTAMVALATVTGDTDGAETRLQQHVAARFARLIERIGNTPTPLDDGTRDGAA